MHAPVPASPRHRARSLRSATLVVLSVLLVVVVGASMGLAPVATVGLAPVAASAAEAPPTTVAEDAGIGGIDAGATSPSPRGEPAPPRTQRVADTAIFVGLLVVLVGGVAVAIWSGRRSSRSSSAAG